MTSAQELPWSEFLEVNYSDTGAGVRDTRVRDTLQWKINIPKGLNVFPSPIFWKEAFQADPFHHVSLIFIDSSGTRHPLEANSRQQLLQILQEKNINLIILEGNSLLLTHSTSDSGWLWGAASGVSYFIASLFASNVLLFQPLGLAWKKKTLNCRVLLKEFIHDKAHLQRTTDQIASSLLLYFIAVSLFSDQEKKRKQKKQDRNIQQLTSLLENLEKQPETTVRNMEIQYLQYPISHSKY